MQTDANASRPHGVNINGQVLLGNEKAGGVNLMCCRTNGLLGALLW